MQTDQLLQQWKRAKQICYKIIEISKNANLHNKIEQKPMEKQTSRQFMSVYEYFLKVIPFSTVYRLCITKEKSQTRVVMVYKDFKDILKGALLDMCQELRNQKDIYKLSYLRKIWEAYCDILKRMMHMFAYLNRPFHNNGRIQELEKTGMEIIVLTLLNEVTIAEYQTIYFRELDRIRKTQDFSNAQTLKDTVDMLYKIHLKLIKKIDQKAITRYTEFYSKFLKQSKEFYQRKYSTIKQLNPAEYFEEVNKIYLIETKIALECFGIGGESVINKEFAEEFIQKYRKILMESSNGLKSILQNQQIHTLKIIIEMHSKLTRNIEGFREQFEEFIFQDLKRHIEEIKNEIFIKRSVPSYCAFMSKIIEKNKYYLKVLKESFMSQNIGGFVTQYKAGVEKAFRSVKLPITIEEILAIFIDAKLKFNSLEESDVEDVIKNAMNIFVCIENKDLFLMKYSQKLAKKLLTISPQTIKNHEEFVQSLKLNCGIKFTERIETIFYEYNLQQQYSSVIKKIMTDKNVLIDFNVRIFSEGAWPAPTIVDIPLHYFPDSLTKAYQCLMIYNTEYNNKKKFKISYLESNLRWIYHFDKEVQNKFSESYFDTNCLQGAMLWLIYTKRPQRINLTVLEHYLEKVPGKVIKENLNKMVETNQNILLRILQDDEIFYEFNSKMKSSKRLITYETGNNNEQEKLFQQQDLSKDREIVLDANIAKFMKSKKVTDFETLFNQISKMIKTFNPQNKDIKAAIQRLIGKELLQRDQKDLNKIKYID